MRDHTLQFVTRQFGERALGYTDGRLRWRVTSREGIDSVPRLQHEQRGHGHASGDGHLGGDVAELLEPFVLWLQHNQGAAEQLGHGRAIGAEALQLEQCAAEHNQQQDAHEEGVTLGPECAVKKPEERQVDSKQEE